MLERKIVPRHSKTDSKMNYAIMSVSFLSEHSNFPIFLPRKGHFEKLRKKNAKKSDSEKSSSFHLRGALSVYLHSTTHANSLFLFEYTTSRDTLIPFACNAAKRTSSVFLFQRY